VRPGFVDPAAHNSIKSYIPTLPISYRLLLPILGPPVRAFYKQGHSPTEHLGGFLTDMAMGRMEGKFEGMGVFKLGGSWIVENKGLRRMMGL
jgi:hypothetical protein